MKDKLLIREDMIGCVLITPEARIGPLKYRKAKMVIYDTNWNIMETKKFETFNDALSYAVNMVDDLTHHYVSY